MHILRGLTFFRCNCDQELTCPIPSNSHRRVKVPAFTYYPLEKRHGRAGRSPCESEIHLSGSGGRVERSRLAFCCCLTLDCIAYKQVNMKQRGFTSTTTIKYGINFLILCLMRCKLCPLLVGNIVSPHNSLDPTDVEPVLLAAL